MADETESEQQEPLLSDEELEDAEAGAAIKSHGRRWFEKRIAVLSNRYGLVSFDELYEQKELVQRKRARLLSFIDKHPSSPVSRAWLRAEEPAKITRSQFNLLIQQKRTQEIWSAMQVLQSSNGELRSTLKLAEQTASIATRDYLEKQELLQEVQAELQEAQNANQQQAEHIQQQQSDLEAMSSRIDHLRDESGKLAEENKELRLASATMAGKTLASALARPETFDGSGLLSGKSTQGQKVVEWITAVKRYGQALKLNSEQIADVAVSLLRGAAAQAWTGTEAQLQGNNISISIDHVSDCLVKRFTPAASVHTARTALDKHKQLGQYTQLAAYVTQFDALCSQIPKLTEDEKCHRFMAGLQTSVVTAICVNPATNELFTDYQRMRASALTYAATTAGCLEEVGSAVAKTQSQLQESKRQKTGNAWRGAQHHSVGAGSSGSGGSDQSGGAGSMKQGSLTKSLKGVQQRIPTPRRPDAHFAYCAQEKICARCYGKNHIAKFCKVEKPQPVDKAPPGFSG